MNTNNTHLFYSWWWLYPKLRMTFFVVDEDQAFTTTNGTLPLCVSLVFYREKPLPLLSFFLLLLFHSIRYSIYHSTSYPINFGSLFCNYTLLETEVSTTKLSVKKTLVANCQWKILRGIQRWINNPTSYSGNL